MAISDQTAILAQLKVFYKDKVESLLSRNCPTIRVIPKERIEGKSVNFSAVSGQGGAVAGSFTVAKTLAATDSGSVEFAVTPGQIFSVYMLNAKEVQASLTKRGGYMRLGGGKMFKASERFRKTLAAALYGRGFGELCATGYSTAIVADTAFNLTLPTDAIMKIDVGSELVIKSKVDSSTVNTTLTVNSISGTTVNVTPDTAVSAPLATDILCLAGSMNSSGDPLLPMGLGGWLPTIQARDGTTWDSYIDTDFFGVDRSTSVERLAGNFYNPSASEDYTVSIQTLLAKCRRQGSQADLIVLNDNDWLTLSAEIEATNTYFTQTSTKQQKNAVTGMKALAASFSTNFIENIYDDPFVPQGRFYILDTSAIELLSYTNVDKVNDGVVGNNPGKQDPMAMDNEGQEKTPYGLIIDDYLNVAPGSDSVDGPSTAVTIQFFGSFAVTNPSVCGVGEFYGSDDYAITAYA
ncbi:Uncharacterised protein [uncultured archaeon]|nr:Uncharacterised protein [uncultured archaeon]